MAKQTGFLPIEGTIGNLTFFKSKDGYMVKTKGGVTGSRIKTDSAFQRTRENNAEFGRAGNSGKLLRAAFRTTITNAKDSRMISRLTANMLKVVQADELSERGRRNVIDGEAALLMGFDFNSNAKLTATVFSAYTAGYDRATGKGEINMSAWIPKTEIAAPTGTTHLRFFGAAAAIDFEGGTFDTDTMSTDPILYNIDPKENIALSFTLPQNSTHPVFLIFGVEFLQEVNTRMYPLNNGAYNACAIVSVSVPELTAPVA